MKVKGSTGEGWELPAADVHNAVCAEFKDLGVQPTRFGDKHRGVLVFQLEQQTTRGERMEVRLYFNMTLGSPAKPSRLGEVLQGWRGKSYTAEELEEGVDLDKLPGTPCRVVVSHNLSEDGSKTYANIDSVLRPKGVKLQLDGYIPLDEKPQRASGGGPVLPSEKQAKQQEEEDVPW